MERPSLLQSTPTTEKEIKENWLSSVYSVAWLIFVYGAKYTECRSLRRDTGGLGSGAARLRAEGKKSTRERENGSDYGRME